MQRIFGIGTPPVAGAHLRECLPRTRSHLCPPCSSSHSPLLLADALCLVVRSNARCHRRYALRVVRSGHCETSPIRLVCRFALCTRPTGPLLLHKHAPPPHDHAPPPVVLCLQWTSSRPSVARLLVALAMSYHRRRDRLRLFSPGISSHRAHLRHGFPLPPLPGLRRSFLVLLSVSSLCGCEARARASRTSRACRARVLCVRRLWTVALFCIGACRAGIHVSLWDLQCSCLHHIPTGSDETKLGLGWTLHSISRPLKSLHPPNRAITINVSHMA